MGGGKEGMERETGGREIHKSICGLFRVRRLYVNGGKDRLIREKNGLLGMGGDFPGF